MGRGGGRGEGEEGEGKGRKERETLAHKHCDLSKHEGRWWYTTLHSWEEEQGAVSGWMMGWLCTSFIATELTPPLSGSTCIGSTPASANDRLSVSMATTLPGELTKPV